MPDILRIKRRVTGSPGAPASLANAELAYNEVDHILYYGEGTGGAGGTASVVVGIGGQGLAYTTNPLMDGVATAGTATQWARGDHRHPSDTTKADASALANYLPLAGGTLTGPLSLNADPTQNLHAATKQYVDAISQGIDAKASVVAATTANITLSGTQTVDGVALVATQRVLVKDQSTSQSNGIYIVQSGAWTRATDADNFEELVSAYVFVEAGTTNADTGWLCTNNSGGALGTTPITWTQFSGAGQVVAGAGLTKTGNTLDIGGTLNRIAVAADSIDISAAYVGQASITTLGTISTGLWNGTPVTVPYGGTGVTTLTGYAKGNGTSAFTASATIPSTDITGLGTMALQNATAVAITGGTIDGITFDMGTF